VQSTLTDSNKRNGFTLTSNGKSYYLYAESPELKQAWKEALQAALRRAQEGSGGAAGTTCSRVQGDTRTFQVVSWRRHSFDALLGGALVRDGQGRRCGVMQCC
jgi:hypothetical protein